MFFSTMKLGFIMESKMCMDIIQNSEDNLSPKSRAKFVSEASESYLLLYKAKIRAFSQFARALRGLDWFFYHETWFSHGK